jgi:thiol-disulfide isomerase/thioredoxin
MKKVLPYILIVVALLVAGGIYLQYSKGGGQSLLPVSLNSSGSDSSDATSADDPKELLKNYGPAPEFAGIDKWFNSDPVTKEQLKGKVVLVDFWTYSCINCIRTLPYITKWYSDYKDKGFVVIGVHTPEFAFEKVPMNVESALTKYGITYPVALDNNYKTWTAYHNQFWPADYLIDKDGNIVYTHFGEGKYDETEKAIRTLLGMEGDFQIPQAEVQNQAGTPEIYFGLSRLDAFGGVEKPNNGAQIYTYPAKLKANQFALEGNWEFNQEAAVHKSGFGRIKLNFNAAKVFMVAESAKPTTIKVYVDGKLIKGVVVSNSDLYPLYDALAGGAHTMEIEVPDNDFQAFTFTFG